ncbi:oxidoreductase NAD-binding domain-containing protein [Fusarium oxysporum f. sp. phaseoli]
MVLGTIVAGGLGLGIFSKLFIRNVSAQSAAPRKVFGNGPALVWLPLESAEMVNHNTKLLRFKLPLQEDVSGFPLTSSVLTVCWPRGRWLPVARPYTPISPLEEPGYIDLLVKRYPDGKQSTHLHSLKPGEKLLFAASLRGYQWNTNKYSHITMIAGGAGITPIYQLAEGILRNPADKTAITLIYGANNDEDILMKREFKQFEEQFPDRFKAIYTVSRPSEISPFRKGYVTKPLLDEVLPSPIDKDTMVFVCGPPAMEKTLVGKVGEPGILQQLGYRKDQIYQF